MTLVGAAALVSILLGVGTASAGAQLPQEKATDSKEKPAAQEEKPASETENAEKLHKAAQSPVTSLISVPIQENWNFGIGPSDRAQNVLNVQPVFPITVGKNWNFIIRGITPVIYQPVPVPQVSGPPRAIRLL